MLAVAALVSITWDGKIHWYEAMVLVIGYILYFIIMFQNDKISAFVYKKVGNYHAKKAEKSKYRSNNNEMEE